MKRRTHPWDPPEASTSARRDLLVISAVALAAFSLGAVFGVFDRLHDWLGRRSPSTADDVLAVLMILTAAFAVFSVRTLLRAEREGSLRKETERRYRALVEQVPTVSYTRGLAGPRGEPAPLYVSPQIERLTGYSAAEWTSSPRRWSERIHPDDHDRIVAASDRASRSATPTPLHQEYRSIAKDGRIVWIRDESTVVATDAEGAPTLVQGVMYDITEQKEAQERIQEAENRYRTMVERVPAVAYTWDAADAVGEAPLRYVSPQIERLLGYTAEEWLADPRLWERLVHPEDREPILAQWASAAALGEPFGGEYRLRDRDGRWVWVSDEAVPVSIGTRGRPIYQGVMIDITRGKRSEQRYRQLVEELPIITYLAGERDAGGNHPLTYMAEGIEPLTGHTAEEWMQRPELWIDMVHPDDRRRVLDEDRRTDRTGDRFEIEYRLVRDDGRVVWVRDSSILVERDGTWPVWQGIIEDITARRESDERLRLAEERYRSLVERLPATVYLDDVDEVSTALYVSPQYERLTGYSPEERIADPGLWTRMLHPDDRERVLAESLRTNETGEPFDVEYRILTKDGRIAWLHDLAYLVTTPDGKSCWQGVLTDTSERRASHEAIARRDRILEAVGHAAQRFLGATSWTDAIDEVLAQLGEAGDASRAAVYRRDTDDRGRLGVALVSEWTGPGVEPLAGRLEGGAIAFEELGLERWAELFERGELIDARTNDLPASERATLERGGVKAILAIPIVAAGEWWGHLVYDQTKEDRVWQQAEVDAVRVVANTLGAAVGRERAERLLSDAERRYRVLVEQIPAITYVDECREDGGECTWPTTYISPQVETILGYSPAEWRDDPDLWTRLIHPDDRERALEADRRHYRSGEPLASEMRLIAKDGTVRWIRDEAVILRDAAGRRMWSQGILLDITERKLAEEHLHAAEERYRSLIETIPAATYIDTVDHMSKAVYMSPQVEQIFGYTPQEWLEQPDLWERGVDPEDLPGVTAKIDRLNEEGVPYEAEYRFRRPDGRIVWVHDQAVVLRDEDGIPRLCQGVMFDITERREAEDQLREAEERFRAIVEHVPAAIYLDAVGTSMETMYVSPQMEQITGIPAGEWTADPDSWAAALHPEDREDVLGRYLAALAAEEPWSGEYRMRTRDGRTIWVHDETTLIHDEAGHHALLLGVLSDITERKLAEQGLRESERREREAAERLRALDEMKNTFLAAVSHELRSPLTSILGLALTLERSQLSEGDRNDLLERLAANARKLDRLLKDLLDIDRLHRGIVEPQYRVTDVGALARRTIESLDALSDRSITVFAEPVVLSVDPAKVERIVENLLMNAARHTTPDRTIWLRVRAQDGGVLIAVEDDGEGVPQELREAIFEPFRQGPTATPHAPGTGIGLSLVGRFAELHGGRAWVEDREGGGASFRVFLPAGPLQAPAEPAANVGAPAHDAVPAGRAEAG